MAKTFHFISGLPRAGSTLLAAILRQNPRFHAGMSSPVAGLFGAMLNVTSLNAEFSPFIGEDRKRRILGGLFDNYYADVEREVIFDTNRSWSAKLWTLEQFFPESKIVCCVRDVPWIMDSFERAIRRNPLDVTRLFADDVARANVYGRVEALAQRNHIVGSAWSSLKEAYYGEQSEKLLLVEYDLLAKKPESTMGLIYDFLGEPAFVHDFDDVAFEAENFDAFLGTPGLHRITGAVRFQPRDTLLPPDLFEKYRDMSFWHDRKGTRASVIAIKQPKIAEARVTPDLTRE